MTAQPDQQQFALPTPSEEIVWMAIGQLRLGHFVHPLSSRPFLIQHPADLAKLKDNGVSGYFVDLTRSKAPRPIAGATRPLAKRATSARPPVAPPAPAIVADPPAARAARFRGAMAKLEAVSKPVEALLGEVRLGRAVSNEAALPIVRTIVAAVKEDPESFVSLARIRSRDRFTYAHSIAVCALMANLAARLKLDAGAQQELALAGLLHDVGKMLVPQDVLNKPGRLSPEEMVLMRSHVERGHEFLKASSGIPATALDVCLHHHEKYDGSGYPERLAGERISLAARMGAVCDVYDAVTSNRPYKEAWTPSECLASMFTWDGHFDPAILGAFIKSVGIYPVGTLVRTQSDNLGVILAQDRSDLTRPIVRLFYAIRSRQRITPRDLALGANACDNVASREDPKHWGFFDWDAQWPRMLAV